MKLRAIVLLLLLILADAIFKQYISSTGWICAAFITLLVCASYLIYFFSRSEATALYQSAFTIADQSNLSAKWIAIASVLLGILFRFWRLDHLFDGLFWDEAYKGLDAIAIREFGERPIFLNWNAGRDALVAYLVSASTWIVRYSGFGVRAVPALAGSLTCVLFYL